MYNVGALTACRVSSKYFAGIAEMPKRNEAANAGISVELVNNERFLKSKEKTITSVIIRKAIKYDPNDVVSCSRNDAKKKVNAGASDNMGVATLASVRSNVLK